MRPCGCILLLSYKEKEWQLLLSKESMEEVAGRQNVSIMVHFDQVKVICREKDGVYLTLLHAYLIMTIISLRKKMKKLLEIFGCNK